MSIKQRFISLLLMAFSKQVKNIFSRRTVEKNKKTFVWTKHTRRLVIGKIVKKIKNNKIQRKKKMIIIK